MIFLQKFPPERIVFGRDEIPGLRFVWNVHSFEVLISSDLYRYGYALLEDWANMHL